MRDENKAHVAVLGHVLEELLERFEPAGRGADGNDGEGILVFTAGRGK